MQVSEEIPGTLYFCNKVLTVSNRPFYHAWCWLQVGQSLMFEIVINFFENCNRKVNPVSWGEFVQA